MQPALFIILCVFASIGFLTFCFVIAGICAEWEWKRMVAKLDARDAEDRLVEGGRITLEELDRELADVNAELKIDHDELRRRVKANTLKLTGREVI